MWGEVDLDAVRANVRGAARARRARRGARGREGRRLRPRRGAGRPAALDAGASWLGVALVEEGVQLRDAGIDAPILVLSEPAPAAAAERSSRTGSRRSCTPSRGSTRWPRPSPTPARRTAPGAPQGRHRHAPRRLRSRRRGRARRAHRRARAELTLAACCTHLAVADEPDDPYTAEQLAPFDACSPRSTRGASTRGSCTRRTRPALLACPRARHDLVRVGIGCTASRRAGARRRCRRAAARAVGAGAGLEREDARRAARACRTGCATSSTHAEPHRDRADRATPTACPATSGSSAARCSSAAGAARSRAWSRWTS